MAKCLMCGQKKGKRECHIVNGEICSLCCGTTRSNEKCHGCEYYKPESETRKYNKLPKFTPMEMENDYELQAMSDIIEQAFCSIDMDAKFILKDEIAKYTLERLLDLYYFKDEKFFFRNQDYENYFAYVYNAINENLDQDIDKDILVKVIGAIYFVLNRRTKGNREYFTIIHRYVGSESGIRIL